MVNQKKKKKKTTTTTTTREVKGKIADLFESWWVKMPIKGTLANTVNPDLTLSQTVASDLGLH